MLHRSYIHNRFMLGYIILLGLIIGSFLNVCICRIPEKQSIVTTPSHCTNCGKRIKWYDLVPVLSYLILKGRCRFCKTKISIQYPLVELLNGAAYLWIYTIKGLSIETLFCCILFSTLLVITVIDLKHFIIPNPIIMFLLIIAIIYTLITSEHTAINALMGLFSASLPLLLLSIVFKGGMGFGDIKLMAVAGILLGWQNILLALMIASILGSIISISLILLKIKKRSDKIPFGPYLSLGIFISFIYGQLILTWYLHLFV